ncbi:hybrid sensor histidine kinase/response regulator [Burkholderia diffusa]|uniref:histidine kinase n=1 Tax=Burkholderia diffusa TaxID=488732 RepID=A0AAW3PDV8_9BURK|nr:ATP-binding protein [Burkholderia diffusa]KWF31835.1 hybrid sensor histidine kinase/response regulator [Burkholderia diffusa]KWF35115.1 hybrid sensor histidine kinase/response regulator [Burkholderia diffusa]KWF48685.1 hybrid sensor histidine kinase/response regulator [Burkholderia diffusa]KWF51536.1 hybrid sensor histidine kinase/response regulator [Burkholderia diffusa]
MRTFTRELFRQGAWVVLAVGLASALQVWAIHVVGMREPFAPLPLYAGVAAAAWLTSFGGGLAATAASAAVVGAWWWRDVPLPVLLSRVGVFVAIGFVECMLVLAVKPLLASDRLRGADDAEEDDARTPGREPARAAPALDDVLLRRVVDASPDAIVGVDAARRITSWNPAARRLFGIDVAAVIGHDVTTLIAPRWLRLHPVPASFANARAPTGPLDILCVRRDGGHFRATFVAAPIVDAQGNCTGLSMTLREANERRRDERRDLRSLRGARDARVQADESNRLKDELLATVSHELRTPLNVIYGWVEVLRSADGQGLAQQAIDAIDRSARSLSRMVGDLLDASSLATGRMRLERTPVDLVRIVHEAVRALGATADANGLELSTACAMSSCVINADGERIRQVLSNLLSNAIKFTPPGGHIKVSLTRAGARVRLSVADTGQGISADRLPHLFDTFNRSEGASASPKRGLGLGLSIVRNIARLHGGEVAAASDGAGRGTTVTVMLPVDWSADDLNGQPLRPSGASAAVALDGQHVLVVDDDATSRASLAAALETLGAQVSTARSGRDALDVVARQDPSVVLSDLAMPDGDGYWLLDHIRHLPDGGGRLPVVAVTAHAGAADRNRVMAAGFDAYLCKPVDMPTLASVIVDVAGAGPRR